MKCEICMGLSNIGSKNLCAICDGLRKGYAGFENDYLAMKEKKDKPILSKETKINLFRLIDSAIEDVRRFAILTDSIDSCPYPVEVLDELYKFKEKLMDKFIADDGVGNE